MTHRFVDRRTRGFANGQRRVATAAETLLWRDLRDRRCGGFEFRRQMPIGPHIVDFVCLDGRLIVELDGRPHDDPSQARHDERRDRWLEAQGFRVLRLANDSLCAGAGELVLNDIREALRRDPSSDPASQGHLLPQREKGRGRETDARSSRPGERNKEIP